MIYEGNEMSQLLVRGRPINIDPEGFLTDLTEWDETVAEVIAKTEGIILTPDHWQVIRFLRGFYQEYQIAPAIRILVKALRDTLGPEKGNSIYLHTLFPDGAAKQSNKIAGLPKPTRCI